MKEFRKDKISLPDGMTEVHRTLITGEQSLQAFTIVSSKRGIYITGKTPWIEDIENLNGLAKVIGEAWTDHTKLRPKILVHGVEH